MNRFILVIAGMFSVSSLLLVDSAVKGTALLILAIVAVLMLRRDSAATRHLVWLLAMVAMLGLPVLSALLPQWRVLPGWASMPTQTHVENTNQFLAIGHSDYTADISPNLEPAEAEPPVASAEPPVAEKADSRPALITPMAYTQTANWSWINALPMAWASGCFVLLLRLVAARWMLWRSEAQYSDGVAEPINDYNK